MRRPPMREDITGLYRGVITAVRPVLRRATRPDWGGAEHLPDGGFVLACNHVSTVDHFPLGHFLVDHGRAPHFLAKSALFEVPGVRRVMYGTGQIPVRRGTSHALDALAPAADAVRRGACVCVYPEGTITRQPDFWPMTGRPGAARLALQTGRPLVPLAIWGTQDILPPYAGRVVPHLVPRHRVVLRAGPPVDLSDLPGDQAGATALAEATDRLMTAITGLLEVVRGERAPAHRFDLRTDAPARGRRRS